MSLALDIVKNGELSEVEKNEIDEQIDSIISKHKNNRYEINKLVFESVSALTSSKNYSDELASKGTLKRFWGNITGKNQQLQRKIDSGLAAAQYASQQTLQKLAEQNLMSFELITVVNNKLNASMLEVETEINNIYGTLVTFFKKTKSDIVQLENRVERLERNVNLLNWQNSIEYQMWDGVEYTELDTYSQIVCMVRDFYDITKGEWTTSDLLLLKSAMSIVGINPREVVNCGEFVRALYMRRPLREKLFEGKMSNEHIEDWYVAITSAVNKGVKLQEEESYIVQGVLKCLLDNNVSSSDNQIVDSLVGEYAKNELALYPQVDVLAYDLMVELLYNIEQIGYVPSEIVEDSKKEDIEKRLKIAEEKYLKGNHQEAFKEFCALAEENCARAMYFIGEYYRFGYGKVVEIDEDKGLAWHQKGAKLGDCLAKLNTSHLYASDSAEYKKIREEIYPYIQEMAEAGDIIAQEICKVMADVKAYELSQMLMQVGAQTFRKIFAF